MWYGKHTVKAEKQSKLFRTKSQPFKSSLCLKSYFRETLTTKNCGANPCPVEHKPQSIVFIIATHKQFHFAEKATHRRVVICAIMCGGV